MWIFLDDSGDSGHKFDTGSTRLVTISACIFNTREDIADTQKLIQASRNHIAPDGTTYTREREYRYSKTKNDHKDEFFTTIAPGQFAIRTILVDKQKLYSPKLINEPKTLKGYMIRQLMTSHFGTISNAKLVIDGKDTRAFDMADKDYYSIVNREAPGTLREISWEDSQQNDLIQLADMIAGAIRRYYELKCPHAKRHIDTFRNRMWRSNGGTFWNFTK